MANPNIKEAGKPYQFRPGQSGNPGGLAIGTRNALNKKFLVALSEEFDKSGQEAISKVAKEDPATFIKVLAAILPKEMEIKRPLDDMNEDELRTGIDALQRYLATSGNATGTVPKKVTESPSGLPTIQ